MNKTTLHIINHTHWDREWFLSSIYTTHWIPRLIDRLVEISATNPDFCYFLDGQTLIIEDLLAEYPDYQPKVEQLIANGNLTIGPYYSQPDWQLTSGELLIRNLEYGIADTARYGDVMRTGWMVDTFGHLSQSPQIHQQAGIDAVYVWRGVPKFEPYIQWQGADGSEILAVNLVGGYRNLYGITHAPEVVAERVNAEVDKLTPFYPTPDLPLFDGYDLEDNPEDSVTYLCGHESGIALQHVMVEATPASFVDAARPKLENIPRLSGEFNAGKYAATFPGIYSARTYLKIMSHDCATLLHRVTQPLATLAWLWGADYPEDTFEDWDRLLLQNSVHDCICGVSIDQVHEKMEYHYRTVFDGSVASCQQSIQHIFGDFAPGIYAISTNPFGYENQQILVGNQAYRGSLNGIGVFPVESLFAETPQEETVSSFAFQNDHYRFEIDDSNTILLNGRPLYFVLYQEDGDTYSDETGKALAKPKLTTPLTVRRTDHVTRVQFHCEATHDDIAVNATITATLDDDPLLRWEIELDSRGVNFRLDLVYESGIAGQIFAGMPFDVVAREAIDSDLMPLQPDPRLVNILLGQRELNVVKTFPFQEYVAITAGAQTVALFAKGLQSYQATEEGTLSLTLRRSVEWVTAGNLTNRLGDAGPFFYVPDARCERVVRHEIAFVVGDYDPQTLAFQRLNALFQNPPLVVEVNGDGTRREWAWQCFDVPMSGLRVHENEVEARLFNPTQEVMGALGPKQIKAQKIATEKLSSRTICTPQILNLPTWRVDKNQGLPEPASIAHLETLIRQCKAKLDAAQAQLDTATGNKRHLIQHQVYIHHREMLEYQLSARLNTIKLAQNGEVSHAYLFEPDPQVVEIGYELNQLRIKRRIYDYVAAALAN